MQVTFTQDYKAAPDGINVREFAKGETYSLPDDVAKLYESRGVAVIEKPGAKVETKVEASAETKAPAKKAKKGKK